MSILVREARRPARRTATPEAGRKQARGRSDSVREVRLLGPNATGAEIRNRACKAGDQVEVEGRTYRVALAQRGRPGYLHLELEPSAGTDAG